MDPQYRWVNQLWSELNVMEPADRIKISGEWIVYSGQILLPKLGLYRRGEVAALLTEPDWDSRRLAETIGASKATIDRLAKEGRRNGAT